MAQQTQVWTIQPYSLTCFDTRSRIDTATCVSTAGLNLMATSSLLRCWNIRAINKCSIINEPQNGSNCPLQPNVSISIPRTFLEQPELFLLSISSQGKKKKKRHWYAEYSLRCGSGFVITILAKLPLFLPAFLLNSAFRLYFMYRYLLKCRSEARRGLKRLGTMSRLQVISVEGMDLQAVIKMRLGGHSPLILETQRLNSLHDLWPFFAFIWKGIKSFMFYEAFHKDLLSASSVLSSC